MKLYSIYDAKAETWLPPFTALNDEIAKRDLFSAISGNANIPLAQYPTDFALVYLGEWEAGTACPIKLSQIPQNLGTVWMIINEFRARQAQNLAAKNEGSVENGKAVQ